MITHLLEDKQFEIFLELINFVSTAINDDTYKRKDGHKYCQQVSRVLDVSESTVFKAFFHSEIPTMLLSEKMFKNFKKAFADYVRYEEIFFISKEKKAAKKDLFDLFCKLVEESFEREKLRKEIDSDVKNYQLSTVQTRLKDLVGLYEGNIYQGQCVDWCQLILKTYEPSQVKGLMKVRYQHNQEDPTPEALLDVHGVLFYDRVIRLSYQNVKKEIPQLGVFLIEYNSKQGITGYFVAYYVDIPKDREKRGEILLKKISNIAEFPPDTEKQE